MNIECTQQEAQALMQLLDLATKHPTHGGMNAAGHAVIWAHKLQLAAAADEQPAKPNGGAKQPEEGASA